nr:hypothetical protein Iba_chr10aCG17940 [Ipomoea batatas]
MGVGIKKRSFFLATAIPFFSVMSNVSAVTPGGSFQSKWNSKCAKGDKALAKPNPSPGHILLPPPKACALAKTLGFFIISDIAQAVAVDDVSLPAANISCMLQLTTRWVGCCEEADNWCKFPMIGSFHGPGGSFRPVFAFFLHCVWSKMIKERKKTKEMKFSITEIRAS